MVLRRDGRHTKPFSRQLLFVFCYSTSWSRSVKKNIQTTTGNVFPRCSGPRISAEKFFQNFGFSNSHCAQQHGGKGDINLKTTRFYSPSTPTINRYPALFVLRLFSHFLRYFLHGSHHSRKLARQLHYFACFEKKFEHFSSKLLEGK